MNTLIVVCALLGACLASYDEPKKSYKPSKVCYQCAYSPPRTYYTQKLVVEKREPSYGETEGYGKQSYYKKTYVPVKRTDYGGWDKCLADFSHDEADFFGVDVWDCHSNCFVRKEKDGSLLRGCYKGEFGVDPHKLGCSYQAGAEWCFCEGSKCNNHVY